MISSAFVGTYDETRTHVLILTNARSDVILKDFEVHLSLKTLYFKAFVMFRSTP